jgi:hypothetical protein
VHREFRRHQTQFLGIPRALRKAAHHIINILLRHDVPSDLAWHIHARRRVPIDITLRQRASLAHATAMPQLRRYFPALSMDCIDHFFPAGKTVFTVEIRHIFITARGNVIGAGTLSNNQANTAGCATSIVFNRGITGLIVWRHASCHRRHYNTIVCV